MFPHGLRTFGMQYCEWCHYTELPPLIAHCYIHVNRFTLLTTGITGGAVDSSFSGSLQVKIMIFTQCTTILIIYPLLTGQDLACSNRYLARPSVAHGFQFL